MKILLVSGFTKDMSLSFQLEADKSWLPVDRILEKPINSARFMTAIEKALEAD